MSTLFFLVFTGLFTQMLIRISGNHIIQLRQFSEAYQAKTALNMSESILKDYIETHEEVPTKGKINTSIGPINLKKMTDDEFILKVTLANGMEYHQFVDIEIPVVEELEPDLELEFDPELDPEIDPEVEPNPDADPKTASDSNLEIELED